MTIDGSTAEVALHQLEFKLAGRIALSQGIGVPTFHLDNSFARSSEFGRSHGWVYVWAKFRSGVFLDVCYVGKAGKTLHARCSQHIGGFRGSTKKGLLNGQRVREFLSESDDHSIHLYARKSPEARVLDEEAVSMCEAEERAMIMKMRRHGADLWNS